MSLASLLNQTVIISQGGGPNKYGKHTFAAGVSYAARFERTTKVIRSAQKEDEPIDGIVFIGPSATFDIGDKLVFDSVDYRIMTKSEIVDGAGAIRHRELMVQRWNT